MDDLRFHWNFFVNAHKYVNTYMNIEQQQQQQENGIVREVLYSICIDYTKCVEVVLFE
jgi:hypothetical protein